MTLLTIIQGVARRMGYPQPVTAVGNSDPMVALMIDCVQDTGDELVERWGWQQLKLSTAATFTGDGTTALFALPANMETLQPDAIFVSSLFPAARMRGPINEDDFLVDKLIPSSTVPSSWRVVANKIEFYPALQSGEVVSYIYQGSYWINNFAAGTPPTYTPAATFVSDSDTVNISERLLRMGARWRWRQAKGLSYDEEMKDYELTFNRIAGQQTTGRNVAMSRSDNAFYVDPDTVFVGFSTSGGLAEGAGGGID